jgi:hypothetical protein
MIVLVQDALEVARGQRFQDGVSPDEHAAALLGTG